VEGELARKEEIWILTMSGFFSVVPESEYIIEAETDLTIETGPVITGSAVLYLFKNKKFKLSNASITLNLNKKCFNGSVNNNFNFYGIEFNNKVNFEIYPKTSSWYIGGKAKASFLGLISGKAWLCFGYNFKFAEEGGKKGIIFDASFSTRSPSIPVFKFSLKEKVHLNITYPLNVSGKYSLSAYASAHVGYMGFGIGLSGSFNGSASIRYSSSIFFNLSNRIRIKGWVGCCKRKGCDGIDVCTKWWVPCGIKVCFTLGFKIGYNNGWYYSISCPLFCD
jgi:hypothetical protein